MLYKNKIVTKNIYSMCEKLFFFEIHISIIKVIQLTFYPLFFIYFVPHLRLSNAFTSIISVVLDSFDSFEDKSRKTFYLLFRMISWFDTTLFLLVIILVSVLFGKILCFSSCDSCCLDMSTLSVSLVATVNILKTAPIVDVFDCFSPDTI